MSTELFLLLHKYLCEYCPKSIEGCKKHSWYCEDIKEFLTELRKIEHFNKLKIKRKNKTK